jgi:hypothetical protein
MSRNLSRFVAIFVCCHLDPSAERGTWNEFGTELLSLSSRDTVPTLAEHRYNREPAPAHVLDHGEWCYCGVICEYHARNSTHVKCYGYNCLFGLVLSYFFLVTYEDHDHCGGITMGLPTDRP